MEQLTQEELVKLQGTISELSQAIAESMRPLAESMQAIAQPLVESMRLLSESIKERERIIQAFQACDLWPAPSMKGLTDKIIQLYDDGKKQVIPSVVSRYYKKNDHAILRKAVSRWEDNSFFQPRMGIIYDALEAHTNGKYTLSVPALLPHIEGIARDIVRKYNLPKLKKPLVYRKEIYGEDGAKTWPSAVFSEFGFDIREWAAIGGLLFYLEGTMYLSPRRVGKTLKDFAKKDSLNRHSILHGTHTKYATSMHSLRCFLALDVLSLIDGKEHELSQ